MVVTSVSSTCNYKQERLGQQVFNDVIKSIAIIELDLTIPCWEKGFKMDLNKY